MSDNNPHDAAAWKRLCSLIDDDPALWPSVEDALTEGDDAWEALIGGLDEAGALAYLDVSDTGMELVDALAGLPRVFAIQPEFGAVNDTDDLADAMSAADAILAESELRLIELEDDDEDAHALVVVPAAAVDEIRSLAVDLEKEVVAMDRGSS
ncbi:hypothetical protein ACFSBZ_04070 [Amnibacterium flavum]|uniref:DUF6630 domain-containing protein n=1 Tax=Amnibacterium flavum TaxID=2173173 RepID=A0A2V1HVF6_9MICO|nr:hypothetical protein [Amnibacterium flavum]PVZ94327.1 hypothetical protein DDQ50_11400 [Amnibacterium flavum]